MRQDIALEALTAKYEELGEKGCSYAPPAGSAVTDMYLILTRPDISTGFEGEVLAPQIEISVRVSDATPAKGGVFTIGEETFKVIATPERRDRLRLEWSCVVDPRT